MRKKIAAVDDIIERFGGKIEDIDLTQRDTARQTVFLRDLQKLRVEVDPVAMTGDLRQLSADYSHSATRVQTAHSLLQSGTAEKPLRTVGHRGSQNPQAFRAGPASA